MINSKFVGEGLTYEDVLLVPAYSKILPSDVSLQTRFSRNISLNVPIVSAAMDTVTERYKDSSQIVTAELRTFMKKMKLEDMVAGGIDYTKLYTQEEFDALGE